ncbi:L-lactate MFS transporter [Anaerosacchariphilus polymeriproducens]|uniref:MFS transporter n=1 Tax=Anaerosacchariphilus polymeriproducens TaxID=1812858 RepID=A0A371AX15_9FIRM|nr:OFA family MFS transporter [Anaerosacchariphilus polymeriproducens]RDU24113.1 MFS transporter [Anaerosacchariphilus polymeriproducens]
MGNKLFLRKQGKVSNLRWLYVILGIIIMLCFGTVYSWSIFRMPVEKVFNIGSTQSGFPYMTSLAFYALFMMLSGRYFNKFSPRVIILTGSLLLSAGWILSSFSPNIYTLTITYGAISGAGVGIAYGVPLAIVTKWFPDKKGFVIGLVLLGFGVSPLVTAPLAKILIEIFGVMKTFLVLGVAFGIIIPILSYPLKYPSESETNELKNVTGKEKESNEFDTKKMIRTFSFKGLYVNFIIGTMVGLMLIGLTSSVGIQLIGLSQIQVALMISFFAIFNGIGRPVFGWITDKFSTKKAMIVSYILIATAALIMSFAGNGSIVLFGIAFSIFWFNLGGWLAIAPTATRILYGANNYSQNFGVVFTAYGIGAVLGVAGSGLILDIFKSYYYIFYLIIVLCASGCLLAIKTMKD